MKAVVATSVRWSQVGLRAGFDRIFRRLSRACRRGTAPPAGSL